MPYPKEITRDTETLQEVASFSYHDGILYALEHQLKQTTNFSEVFNKTHYIVCCGDVMVKVETADFPSLIRRPFKVTYTGKEQNDF